MKTLTKALSRLALGAIAAFLAGGLYAETHRVPNQP
jgi:hypothetical protein